jgi:hypothetical protein
MNNSDHGREFQRFLSRCRLDILAFGVLLYLPRKGYFCSLPGNQDLQDRRDILYHEGFCIVWLELDRRPMRPLASILKALESSTWQGLICESP